MRFVCSVLTLEKCCEWGGSYLMDLVCWTMVGEVRRVRLRAGRFVELDHERAGSWKHWNP